MKKFLSSTVIIALSAILLVYASDAHSELESSAEPTHFIVLIRDTGLMDPALSQKLKKQGINTPLEMIVPTLPKLLFEGLTPSQPIYHPNRDHLSVVFVGIHNSTNPNDCKNAPGLSALPKHLFQWQPVVQKQNQADFTRDLRQWTQMTCRAQGHVYSSVLAQTMILPYVQKKLPKTLRFSRTILVMLDNDAVYGLTLPSTELAELATKEHVKDIDQAATIVDRVSTAFHIATPREWVFTIKPSQPHTFKQGNTLRDGTNTLRYRLAEVKPLDTNVDNYLDYTKTVRLDRLAISDDKLQLVQQGGGKIGLRLLPSNRLQPEKITLSFFKQGGGDWFIGQHSLPKSAVINVADCIKSKQCKVDADGVIFVPLLGNNLYLSPDDYELSYGKIDFQIRFSYKANEVYNFHDVDTKIKTVNIQAIKPFVIPANMGFPKIVLDNETLTDEYEPSQDSENGLTQEIARARIVAARNALKLLYFLIFAILLILFVYLLYRYSPERSFKPKLKWQAAKKIDLNFNQQPGARLLVGTLVFMNKGQVSKLGGLCGKTGYPDYTIEFSLSYNNEDLKAGGFLLSDDAGVALGFRDVSEETKLMRKIKYRVSHETPIYVFLATDVITDFNKANAAHTVTFGGDNKDFQITVDLWRGNERELTQPIEFEIKLIPEEAKPPRVVFQEAEDRLYFDQDKNLTIGAFHFQSQAQHRFAESFQDSFTLRNYKNNLPLAKDDAVSLLLADNTVKVAPLENTEVKLAVSCDGEVVPNPEPPNQDYSFNLIGEFAPGSQPDNHWFSLYRDPTIADLHLDIVHCNTTHRIHWEEGSQSPTCRLVEKGIVEADGQLLQKKILTLPPFPVDFDGNMPPSTIFEIHVGNTGKAGRGWVKANLSMELKIKASVRNAIKTKTGYIIDDALRVLMSEYEGVFQGNEEIVINEGEPMEKILVQLDAATTIADIIGGRIKSENAPIEATLDISIQDDLGNQKQHQLTIVAPIGLEKLPHQNWLCIDFGTSAIVAAIGMGNKPYFLPLQKLVRDYNEYLNFGDFDSGNSEQGTDFLPSQIICDADLRQGEVQDKQIRKGYPRFQPASLKPGDADFIGLPATRKKMRDNHGRVIFSLKSWLAQPTDTISLQDPVPFLESSGREVPREQLPLEAVLESGFAALAKAYITASSMFKKGGQVVLSHPNTFTSFHRKKLHDIACRALSKPLGIALPEERIRLISESDAVAFHYCRQRMSKNRQRTGWERLLVYDFGAGTLDLSLIHVRWNKEGFYPEKWQVENRLGVPIAGNHLDSLLARLIDKCLKDKSVLDPELLEYRYPVVDVELSPQEKATHRRAIYTLWDLIKQAKHSWDGKKRFRIRVAEKGIEDEVVRYKQGDNFVSDPNEDADGIFLEQEDIKFYLNIPSKTIHDYLNAFIDFVTNTVIDELLQAVNINAVEVDTVIVSGRGALWAGLRQGVWDKFPEADKPDLMDEVKSAVVSGAIAWQELSKLQDMREPDVKPRLGILRDADNTFISEEAWKDGAIDLRSSGTFSLVQVAHQHPDPEQDMQSLRRYFYITLASFRREWKWSADPRLYVTNDNGIIRLANSLGQGIDFKGVGSISQLSSMPPWPIGQPVLSPE